MGVGQDPEARCTPTGKWVTHFSLAVNERYAESETTTWFRVEAMEEEGIPFVRPEEERIPF